MNNQTTKRITGDLGERIAANYLRGKGYEILEMNYQNNIGRRLGEIDIIAKDTTKNDIVFVEVKTRDMQKYSATLPEENITYPKLRKLEKIANAYLNNNRLNLCGYRFDAISVWVNETEKTAKVKHIICL